MNWAGLLIARCGLICLPISPGWLPLASSYSVLMLRDWHCPVCIEWPEVKLLVHSMVLVDMRDSRCGVLSAWLASPIFFVTAAHAVPMGR